MSDPIRLLASKFDLKGYIKDRFKGQRVEWYGKEAAVPCPTCDTGPVVAKPHLYINVEKQQGVCYRCRDQQGAGLYHDLLSIIVTLEGTTYHKALVWLRDRVSLTRADLRAALERLVREEEPEEVAMEALALPEGFKPAIGKLPTAFQRFYDGRGLTEEQRQLHGVGYTTRGFYAWRSIVPVTMDGTRWTWVGRDVTGRAEKKVLYPKGSKTSRLLFNYDRARSRGTIVLVEGVYDAIRVGDPAVAILGTTLSTCQLSRLVEAGPHTVVVMMDPDAQAKALDLGWQLTAYFPRVKVVALERDPDEYVRRELWHIIATTDALDARSRLRARLSALAESRS